MTCPTRTSTAGQIPSDHHRSHYYREHPPAGTDILLTLGTATEDAVTPPEPVIGERTNPRMITESSSCEEYPLSMPRLRIPTPRRWVALAVAATLALAPVSGCGTTATAPTTGAPVTTTPARPVPPPGTVLVTGALKQPFQITIDQLHTMPMHTVQAEFQTDTGTEQHTEIGVLLAQLIPATALATQNNKHDSLSFAVLAVGADAYQAAVSYGEISPDFANKEVLVAVTQDGKPLSRPRLVVPGDIKGARYVNDLIELHVSRLTPR